MNHLRIHLTQFWFNGSGVSLRTCISNKLLGDAGATNPQNTLASGQNSGSQSIIGITWAHRRNSYFSSHPRSTELETQQSVFSNPLGGFDES